MSADGDEVNSRADEHEAVPYRVSERYNAVALEEDDTDHIDRSASCQLAQSRHLLLCAYIQQHTLASTQLTSS